MKTIITLITLLTLQQGFVSQECQQAEYIRQQMVAYGTEYNIHPMNVAKIVKFSYQNECPLNDMYYNEIINEKQLRVAKLMELWIRMDYNCKNKKRV